MPEAKPTHKITPSDLERYPVWVFDLANEGLPGRDETWMVPVENLPVSSLECCGCLANATLACGRKVIASLWNIHLESLSETQQFGRISLWLDDRWWQLSERSFISDSRTLETHLPIDLASKLGLELQAVFPISYDISEHVNGPPEITRGKITGVPLALSRDEMREILRTRRARRLGKI